METCCTFTVIVVVFCTTGIIHWVAFWLSVKLHNGYVDSKKKEILHLE